MIRHYVAMHVCALILLMVRQSVTTNSTTHVVNGSALFVLKVVLVKFFAKEREKTGIIRSDSHHKMSVSVLEAKVTFM